jgi:hypothetical protein
MYALQYQIHKQSRIFEQHKSDENLCPFCVTSLTAGIHHHSMIILWPNNGHILFEVTTMNKLSLKNHKTNEFIKFSLQQVIITKELLPNVTSLTMELPQGRPSYGGNDARCVIESSGGEGHE